MMMMMMMMMMIINCFFCHGITMVIKKCLKTCSFYFEINVWKMYYLYAKL